MNLGGKNWDRKLRDEERRLTKLLEELSVKTDMKLDSSGFPLLPTVSSNSIATQTESNVQFYNDDDETIGGSLTNGNNHVGLTESGHAWDKLVIDQLHNDFNYNLAIKDAKIADLQNQVKQYEQTLIEVLQWKNSMSNHITLLLHNYHRSLLAQQAKQQQAQSTLPAPPLPPSSSTSSTVSKQQQQKLSKLHDRIVQVATENLSIPECCSHLNQTPLKLTSHVNNNTQENEVETRKKLDRFSNYYHDYDFLTRSNLNPNDKGSAISFAPQTGQNAHQTHRGVRVLHATEEEICGYTFDLLLRLQATHADFRDVPDKATGSHSKDVTSSISLRHFLMMLLALDAIDTGCTLTDAIEAFHLVAHRTSSALVTQSLTPSTDDPNSTNIEETNAGGFDNVAKEESSHWTLRINYLEFVQALEYCATCRAKASLKTSASTSVQGFGAFIFSWASRLDRFVADFEFFHRVAVICYPVTHSIVIQVLCVNQAIVVPHAIRQMNYQVINPQKGALLTASQAVGLSTTGFEVFCINHDIVPQLLPPSAVRRMVQYVQSLFAPGQNAQKKNNTSHATILCLLVVLAQYMLDLRQLDKSIPTTDQDQTTGNNKTSSKSHIQNKPQGLKTAQIGVKTDRLHTQLQQALMIIPILEDFFVRILRNMS